MTQDQERDAMAGHTSALALPGSQSAEQLQEKMRQMSRMIDLKKKFLQDQLKEGIDRDYANIPGCGDKKVLLKPGAEKLLNWHSYYADFSLVAEKEDWDIGLFAYVYRCEIKQIGTGFIVGSLEGDASTHESKYRYETRSESQLPPGSDPSTFKQKIMRKKDGSTFVKYLIPVDDPADKRNTVRKMAQKRAFIGATVLATGTSDLFAADVDPDDLDPETGELRSPQQSTGGETKTAPRDYGNPISEKQSKRLFAIRQTSKIDQGDFKKWLKAKYGLESDREIGYKIYDEIVTACQSGKLEMPPEKPADKQEAKPDPDKVETKPEQAAAPAKASGPTLSAAQIKGVWDAIGEVKSNEETFLKFLHEHFMQYGPKDGINQILGSDFEQVRQAFITQMKGA